VNRPGRQVEDILTTAVTVAIVAAVDLHPKNLVREIVDQLRTGVSGHYSCVQRFADNLERTEKEVEASHRIGDEKAAEDRLYRAERGQ
jgi:hypothetical protein